MILIIPRIVLRRLHVTELHTGSLELDRAEAHHARDVLRLSAGDEVELFDDAGAVAHGVIERCDAQSVTARVDRIERAVPTSGITIASAVPKGERADWMIEKLSELGVERFIPLVTARSVVAPAGRNKRDRWLRLATESAKQSRRAGVMRIDELTDLARALSPSPGTPRSPRSGGWKGRGEGSSCFLSTDPQAQSIFTYVQSQTVHRSPQPPFILFIGPEGGWTPDEIDVMTASELTAVKLTATILRVETAAVAAAAIVASWRAASR